jgi:hypothetical protein
LIALEKPQNKEEEIAMGLFSSLGKLGKAAVGTALLPVDILRDAADARSKRIFVKRSMKQTNSP